MSEGSPTVVHVLWEGLPLCGFTTDMPYRWPEGHKWVSAAEDISAATCEECFGAAHFRMCSECASPSAARAHGKCAIEAGRLARQLNADFVFVVALQHPADGDMHAMSASAQTPRVSQSMQVRAAQMLREIADALEARAKQ